MFAETDYILKNFQVRKSAAQKSLFRSWLSDSLKSHGYGVRIESGGSLFKSSNVIVGDPETAKVVYTAHYDTCSVLPFPNFITPQNLLLYLLYQILIVIPMFVLAIGAELLLLLVWNDAPMWLAMLVVYFVLAFCIWWMMAGPANRNTMNDNTSGVATLMEIALSLSEEERSKVAFIFFDNEEKGLLGSSLFKKLHSKKMKNTLVINFDCVSDGDYIQFYPNKALKKNDVALTQLETSFQPNGTKHVEVVKGFGFYPSDQKAFVNGVGVAAMHKSWFGYWLGRIHTNRDTVFDEENIELLRLGALKLASTFSKP